MTGWSRLSILFIVLTGAFSALWPQFAQGQTTPRRIVVCPFQSSVADVSNSTAAALSDLLMVALADDKEAVVVDHSVIDAAMRETALAGSGLSREADAMILGRIVKADLAITGVFSQTSHASHITVRTIDPKSGVLLDTAVIPFNMRTIESSVSTLKRLISNAVRQTHRTRKKKHITFGHIAIQNSGKWDVSSEELKSSLQKHYLAHPEIDVVVRSQVDAMLVERYLRSTQLDAKMDCLTGTPSAGVITDILLEPKDNGSRIGAKVKLDIVGLSPHIETFELNPADSIAGQLILKLDDILNIHWEEIRPERSKLADYLYQNAMKIMQFSYRNEYFVDRNNFTYDRGDDNKVKTLEKAVELFSKALDLDPRHDLAMVALAHCYSCKALNKEKRADDLFRKVYFSSDNLTLKRIAKTRIRDGKISEKIFEGLTPHSEYLMSELEQKKYINAKGYVLNAFSAIDNPKKFELSDPFDPIREQVYYLLQETTPPFDQPKLGSSSEEAIRHYHRGQRLSHYRFKPKSIPKTFADREADYLSWQYTFPPEVVPDEISGSKHKSAGLAGLNAAINEYASALFLDPQFYEAMVMLSVCLRNPLIGQNLRADRLLEVVLCETHDEYLKYYAAEKLKKLQTTRFSGKLTSLLPQEIITRPGPNHPPRSESIRRHAAGKPGQAVTMAVAFPVTDATRTAAHKTIQQALAAGSNSSDKPGGSDEPLLSTDHAKGKPSTADVQFIDCSLIFESADNPEKQNGGRVHATEYVPSDRYSRTKSMGKSVAISSDFALIGSPWTNLKYSPFGARRKGGAVFLLRRLNDSWTYVAQLTGDEPAWMNTDQFGRAVGICRRFAIVGTPLDKDRGPLQLQDIRKIKFESDVDPELLMNKLFSLGYLDVHNLVAIDVHQLETELRQDFPECSSKDLYAITRAIKASLQIENTGTATIFDLSSDPLKGPVTLRALDAHEENKFGRCVAIDDRHAIVGSTSGLYVFERDDNQWRQTEKLTIGCIESCDLSGDTAIVGARTQTPQGMRSSVHIYHLKDGQWFLQAELSPALMPDNFDGRQLGFGSCVAVDGEYAVVGNPYENFGVRSEQRSGAVSLYERKRDQWLLYATLTTGPDAESGGNFGESVDIAGDCIVVGEPEATADQKRSAGATHLFKVEDGGVRYLGRVTKEAAKQNDRLGEAVAVNPDYILIGVPRDDNLSTDSGAAYLVKRP